ncbi:high affinity cGMP-specific 3',5'-cyclic phosphodiesterase 9A [Nilaparvata lugens]|uniref:high affinity cGMP-specific 3',5'-cyclic phosphodiesterase 9A n=1 Tax=Nilaparvata lugens TaxID=108931 RepID=UPI00193D8C35|nr:high affinity cGMP-specific 3',5'-cyclic phosphodiesterase 9A [Nilaparvata lugens]
MSGARVVYIIVQGVPESFLVDSSPQKVKELLRQVAGVKSASQLSLYDTQGRLVNLGEPLQPNSPATPYRLHLAAPTTGTDNCNGMLVDEVTMDLVCLENRVSELENQLAEGKSEPPSVVKQLKEDIEKFRLRLETTKHLSWLSCYKELPPSNRRLQYRRQSDAKQKLVRENFLKICEQSISEEVRQCLRLPSFDCSEWEDQEILLLLQFMFLDFDLPKKFNIDMTTLRNLLMYAMCWRVDLPSRIGDLETLILITSCICHDLDHPGYNNIYQINARTELALRYNDISPLENHHCSMAFRILELPECNIFRQLGADMFRVVREGIIRCILATDMARHNEILAQFREACEEGFDYTNKTHVNLLCMVLIKVADISNEARPMEVAEPWLDKLLQEFFTQSDAEKQEGLPVTPFMDRDKITKPSSQCSFIGFVLLPLFEALGDLFQELQEMLVEPVRYALDYYRRLNEAAKDEHRMHRKSIVAANLGGMSAALDNSSVSVPTSPTRPPPPNDIVKSSSGTNVRKPSISFSQMSRCEDDSEEILGSEEVLPDLSEDSDEEETVTEVAVSEKALKFKISTESSSSSGRKSYPGSRKGSREKTYQLAEQEIARVLRGHDRSIRSSDSGEKRSWSSGEQTSADNCCLSADGAGKRNINEDSKDSRSYSLAEQEWRRDLVHGQYNKKTRSISAGSPEGLREFRSAREFREVLQRRSSPSSPKDFKMEKDSPRREESRKIEEIIVDRELNKLDVIKEGCAQGCVDSDVCLKDEIVVVVNSNGNNQLPCMMVADNNGNNTVSEEVVSGSSKLDENSDGVRDTSKSTSPDLAPDEKVQKKSPSSLLRRLKTFSERFSKSSDLGSPKGSVERVVHIPASPASLKNQKVEEKVVLESERRAMTLPKTTKKKPGSGSRPSKGWKGMLKSKTSIDKESSRADDDKEKPFTENVLEEKVGNGVTPPDEDKG